MIENIPSKTAQRVALRRAAHQLVDDPRVFEDPLALTIIGKETAALLTSEPEKFETFASRHMRAFIAARSRFAEDELKAAVARGVRQYVVLGAGLDTFACRNPYSASDLHVFEVDHPATQTWKRARLAEAGISVPSSVTFVPTNFESETLADALRESDFKPDRATFFSWLGVTPYLTPEAAVATLTFIASMPAESGVAFDYAVERSSLSPLEQMALDALASRVVKAGEPFQLFLNSEALMGMLKAMGFRHVDDLGPEEIEARYFKDREDGLRVAAGLAHLVSARV
jgi:methyltransferase (TIGR00027 family)